MSNESLARDELERDLTLRDKQSLISDCLRLWDTNKMVMDLNAQQAARIAEQDDEVTRLRRKLSFYENVKPPWWKRIFRK